MTNQVKFVAGIDIGTTKIVAIIGAENQYGKLEILGYGRAKSTGMARGVVNNITDTVKSIKSAVDQAQSKAGVTITEAYVGIAGQHIHSREVSDYIVRENPDEIISLKDLEKLEQNIRNIKEFPGEEILHVLPQEYKVDNQGEIRDPEGMIGSRLEGLFHLVIGNTAAIKNIERCVEMAGIKLKGLVLEPLASSASVLSDDEKEAGVALVDIGGGTTDLAIFKDSYIRYTAVIPFGGNVIDSDIREGCDILNKQAETIKIRFGSAWPEATKANEVISVPGLKGKESKEIRISVLAEIIKARMEEIIDLIYNELKTYGLDESKKKLIGGIVLTGGGSELKDLSQLVEYRTGLSTRIGLSNEHLAGNTTTDIEGPSFATSVGLLIKALESEKLQDRREKFQFGFTGTKAVLPEEKQHKEKELTPIIESESSLESEKVQENENEKEQKETKRGFFGSIKKGLVDFFGTMEE